MSEQLPNYQKQLKAWEEGGRVLERAAIGDYLRRICAGFDERGYTEQAELVRGLIDDVEKRRYLIGKL